MSERANFQNNYLMRYLIMALICIGGGLWFAYDGFIAWPRDLPASRAYDELREIEDSVERIEKWEAIATENGWPKSTPKKTAEQLEGDIIGQYFWMAICFAAGIPALIYFVSSRGTWVEATDSGLKTSWGQEVDFENVTLLNKRRWAKKGIAKAYYNQNGVAKIFTFDDFKFEREPIGKMLRRLEESLERDKIVGGPTEAEFEAARANSQSEQSQEDEAQDVDVSEASEKSS